MEISQTLIDKFSECVQISSNNEDYPFNTWDLYYDALLHYLKYGVYSDSYPMYKKKTTTHYEDIKSMLESGLNPQQGLYGFLLTIIHGHKYSVSIISQLESIIRLFLSNGAEVDDTIEKFINDCGKFDLDVSFIKMCKFINTTSGFNELKLKKVSS
jgi:hypothetical protein